MLTLLTAEALPASQLTPVAFDVPEVSLITCAPGKEIYQLEGHSALRIKRPGSYDVAVNWGVFDFNAPNFVYRFVKGETDYIGVSYPFSLFLEEYTTEGREVTQQRLNLTPQEAMRLEQLVIENMQPENRTYRYNYVKDNCATRPLAMIEAAIVDTLTFSPPAAFTYIAGDAPVATDGSDFTFRKEMSRYHSRYPWYQFGIDIALGSGIDRDITQRERAFSPLFLKELAATATVANPDGSTRKLVAEETTLLPGKPGGAEEKPTPWPLTPMAVSIAVLAMAVALSVNDIRRMKISRWFDSILYGAFTLAGLLLTFLIFISSHESTSPNWLYLWLNPLCVIAAVGVWLKSCKRVVYWYQFCNFAALLALLLLHYPLRQAFNPAFYLLIAADLTRSFTYIYVTHITSRRKKFLSRQTTSK